jgi:hypothetical protein
MNYKIAFPAALAVAITVAAVPATAQMQQPQKLYKYVDAHGKVSYSERPPVEATGKAMEQLNRQGAVTRQVQAAPTAEEIAAAAAERRRKQDDEARLREENRRNQALLDTYASERDIELSRSRALEAVESSVKDAEAKLAEALKRQEKLKAETEFYAKKTVPGRLKQEIENNEREIGLQREAIAKRDKEVAAINAKYGEDKRRFIEVTRPKSAVAPATAAPAQPAVPPATAAQPAMQTVSVATGAAAKR